MIESFFAGLEAVDDFFWSYLGFMIVVAAGIYFTAKSKFFQFRTLANPKQMVADLRASSDKEACGTSPIRLYFASVGGMIGIGNIVGVITSLVLGGPGALLWLWVASFAGMLIKYAEIYLGVRHRVKNDRGGYDGGPMYYLREAFNSKVISTVVCVLLCIYGVEVYQFVVVTDTMVNVLDVNRYLVIAVLLGMTLFTALGGVKRLANICSVMMPGFMMAYVLMCLYVIGVNIELLPGIVKTVIDSAFNGHAAVGGFAGSTVIAAAQYGIARAVYSGDIGIGYDATIQSETKCNKPEYQARVAIFALLSDSIICTMSMLVVLMTGIWKTTEKMLPSEFVAKALSIYFPYIEIFMGVLLFLAAFTTIIAFFTVGMKCARFLSNKWGEKLYTVYAMAAFVFFSFFDQTKVMLIMNVCAGMLMLLNITGIWKMRKEIKFK